MTFRLTTNDVKLENDIVHFLHAHMGEEGKLWQRDVDRRTAIFSFKDEASLNLTKTTFEGRLT
jgi:hypothetical protein